MNKELKFYSKPFNYKEHALAEPNKLLIFLIGDKSSEAYKNGDGETWEGVINKINSSNMGVKYSINYKPLLLTSHHLQNIGGVTLADKEHKNFIFFECGKVSDIEKQSLIRNLATKTKANYSKVYYHKGEHSTYKDIELYTYNRTPENLNENGLFERIASGKDEIDNIYKRLTPTPEVIPEGFSTYEEYFKQLDDLSKAKEFLKYMESGGALARENGIYYKYNGKYWEILLSEDELDPLVGLIIKFFIEKKLKYKKRRGLEIRETLPYLLPKMKESRTDLLTFRNGILNKKTGELLPHDQNYYLTNMINLDYQTKEIPTKYFDKFMDSISKGDQFKKDVFYSCLYMILANRYDWQKFIEITGRGGTGKTLFVQLAQMLVGELNSEVMPLCELNNPHALKDIVGKMLVIAEDQEAIKLDGGTLRTITGNGMIRVEPKYKDGYSYKPKLIYIITNNTPIIFTEKNGGTSRRRVLILINNEIDETEKIKDLDKKLEQELNGIIYKVLNRFKNNPDEANKILKAQIDSEEALLIKETIDPLYQFTKAFKVVEKITTNCMKWDCRKEPPHKKAREIGLYQAYESFCHLVEDGKSKLSKGDFKKTLPQILKEQGKRFYTDTIDNKTVYTNLQFINMKQTFTEWEN